jgi:colanic acid biosynthesis glycosyl transferase WcaI
MRIAFVVYNFPPEVAPSAVMAEELCAAWARDGHQVTAICPFPSRPQGRLWPGFSRRPLKRCRGGPFEVIRVGNWLIGEKRRAVNRILENVTFGLASAFALMVMRRPDVVLVETYPVLAYLPVLAVALARRIPMLNYVKDIYPEAAESAGVVRRGSLLSRVLAWLDGLVCSASARNIVISEGMRQFLARARGLPPERFKVISDWLDLFRIRPYPRPARWRGEVGIAADEFACMFAGTMGFASGADVLAETAELLAGEPKVRIVCVGEGVLKERMILEARQRKLANITFLPYQPRERVSEMQSCADVMLLTSAPDMGVSSVPCKLITYLAVGKPVICAVSRENDVARLVEENRLGVVVEPGSARALAEAIRSMRRLPAADLVAMGRRARRAALERHSLQAAAGSFRALFHELGLLEGLEVPATSGGDEQVGERSASV